MSYVVGGVITYTSFFCGVPMIFSHIRSIKNGINGYENLEEVRDYDIEVIKDATEYYRKKKEEGINIDYKDTLDKFQDIMDKIPKTKKDD